LFSDFYEAAGCVNSVVRVCVRSSFLLQAGDPSVGAPGVSPLHQTRGLT
jgi:hypothetical protein